MKKDKQIPYEKRTSCKYCRAKGYLKIIKNENTNETIRRYLHETKSILLTFDINEPRVECYCQLCGNYSNYYVEEGLFADGVIKEI
jgi:hypothetical protein